MASKVNRGAKLKVVPNDNDTPTPLSNSEPVSQPEQEVFPPNPQEAVPEDQPMYTLSWTVELTYKDKMGEHTLGTYSNNVMYDTQKLLERASTMIGQQVFQKIVEDQNV